MSAKGYYVYQDSEGRFFYLDAITQQSSYECPTDGPIYDPKTLELWKNPNTDQTSKKKHGHRRSKSRAEGDGESNNTDPLSIAIKNVEENSTPVIKIPAENGDQKVETDVIVGAVKEDTYANLVPFELDVPESVAEFQPNVEKPPKPTGSFVPTIIEDKTFLPSDISQSIHQFQIQDYAKQFFRQHRTNHVFNRKRVALDALVSFSDELITEPLLEALDKNCTKIALQCFKWILQYTGVSQSKSPAAAAESIVNSLMVNPALRDELYFQLIKQTSHTPSNEFLVKGMELFLIIGTIFPSSRNSENWIKAHLVMMSKHSDLLIASISQFAYIRFSARCACGKPKDQLELNYIKKIPQQVTMSWQTFGASIYEMLWNQRLKEPKLSIPFIIFYMSQFLLRRGAEKTEGIFRLSGNLKRVEEMAAGINDGKDCISAAPLHDIASLFKKWFRDLPDPVVPVNRVVDLLNISEDENRDYIGFACSLPKPHKMILMYLVGFLQQLVKSSSVTKMDSKNMGIVFGPNIVQTSDITEPNQAKKFSTIAIDFLKHLIDNWETSEIYPLKPEYLTQPLPPMNE